MRISDWSSDVCSCDLVILTGGNPITQVVDPGARTITNITQGGHRYHSGTVEISITPTWYGSAVSIEGRGTGPHYLENRLLGAALFSALADRKSTRLNSSH